MTTETKEDTLPPIFYVGFLTGTASLLRENGDERRAKRLDEASAALRDSIISLSDYHNRAEDADEQSTDHSYLIKRLEKIATEMKDPDAAAQVRVGATLVRSYDTYLDQAQKAAIAAQRDLITRNAEYAKVVHYAGECGEALRLAKKWIEWTDDCKFEDILRIEASYNEKGSKGYNPDFIAAVRAISTALSKNTASPQKIRVQVGNVVDYIDPPELPGVGNPLAYDEWTATPQGALALTIAARCDNYAEATKALRAAFDAGRGSTPSQGSQP